MGGTRRSSVNSSISTEASRLIIYSFMTNLNLKKSICLCHPEYYNYFSRCTLVIFFFCNESFFFLERTEHEFFTFPRHFYLLSLYLQPAKVAKWHKGLVRCYRNWCWWCCCNSWHCRQEQLCGKHAICSGCFCVPSSVVIVFSFNE